MIGVRVGGKYEVLQLIGEGGMGAVYEASDVESDARVAVKVISDEEVAQDDVLVARFEREAQAAATVHSPHIVEILGAGHDEETGHPYMVMELLEGENVLETLQRLGPLPPQLAIRIGIQTCRGLAEAHEVGVVHRDIKPANLFLHQGEDGKLVVKLLDFGVAKFKMDQAQASQNQSLTRTGSMLGSPMYMSPEQARGLKTIDHRADLWSLGIVMYQLLTGRQPHDDIDGLGELIITICSEPPEPVTVKAPWCSARLAEVVQGALKLSTEERYQSANEMADALRGCLTHDGDDITPEMIAPLDEAQRAERPVDDAPAPKDDATIALDDPDNYDPSDAAIAPASGDLGDAKTVALDPEDVASATVDVGNAATEPMPKEIPGLAKRSEPMTSAQRAALAAAQLPAGDAPATRVPWAVVVAVVLGLALASYWFFAR